VLSVIMAGGVGERFWPMSRSRRPKQLLDLTGRGSMIALTVERLRGLSEPEEILVITNAAQRDAVVAALAGRVPEENVIGEPVGRNTAPCIGLAAVLLQRRHGDEPMVVLPADHLVEPTEDFQRLVRAAGDFVRAHPSLLTFGVRPARPDTGYGYIQAGERVGETAGFPVHRVAAFLEKPDEERAREFLAAGGYYWNSGMFMWTTSAILREIAVHLPDLARVLDRIDRAWGTGPLPEVLKGLYPGAPSISIDYGVMEKADDVVVIEAAFAWNDVGSWEFVRDVHRSDEEGNVAVGDVVLLESSRNTVVAGSRLVATLGVEGLVVVETEDAVLVCGRDRVQEVKRVVAALREGGRRDLL